MALAGAYKLFDQENDVVKNIKAILPKLRIFVQRFAAATGQLCSFSHEC